MNVMLFSRIVAKSGVGNHIKELSEELVRQGHNVVIVSGTNELSLGGDEVKFVLLPTLSNSPIAILGVVFSLHKLIKEYNIDVVHCHHRKAALYMRLYNVIYKHIPVVYTLHLTPIPCDFIHRILTFVGDKAIGVSTDVSDFLVEKLKIQRDKVVTVLNGVVNPIEKGNILDFNDVFKLKSEWNIQEGKYVFVTHSRIDTVKNHLAIIEAVKLLPEEIRNKFVVVCSGIEAGGYYQKCIKTIEEYGLEDSFRFVGWCDTLSIFSIADCLLLPSFIEGFALSVIEAFHMNVLVARTDCGGFKDQKYCLKIDANNPETISKLIADITENGLSEYETLRKQAKDFASLNFTIEKMTENIVKVYKEVL